MEHDLLLHAAARAIYDAYYPSDDQSPLSFDEAERCRTVRYRQATQRPKPVLHWRFAASSCHCRRSYSGWQSGRFT